MDERPWAGFGLVVDLDGCGLELLEEGNPLRDGETLFG
jgi:hypothetical protein